MEKGVELFELIKSLSKAEKRFIKIYASCFSVGDKNSYLLLFNTLDKLKKYDEAKLEKKLLSISYSGNFRGLKNYLYNLILDCLDFHHQDASIFRRAGKYVNISKILSEKRLDSQSNKMIERAKKLSNEFSAFENIVALNELKKDIEFKKETISNDKIIAFHKENISAIDGMRIKQEYKTLYDELRCKREKMGSISNLEEKQRVKLLFENNHYLVTPPPYDHFDANLYYLLSKIEYYRIVMDTKAGSVYIRKLIALLEGHKDGIAVNVNHYIYALNVFVSERAFGDNKNEAYSILKKVVSVNNLIKEKIVSRKVKIQVFQIYFNLVCHIPLVFRDYEYAIAHIKSFEVERKKAVEYITPAFRQCLEANMACVYFGVRQYKEALKLCAGITDHPLRVRCDVLYIARMLSLLIHYEIGNKVILQHLLRSTQSSFKKIVKNSPFQTVFLKYFKILLSAESTQDQKQIFIEFRNKLSPLTEDTIGHIVLENIDLIGWIDRKIKNPA